MEDTTQSPVPPAPKEPTTRERLQAQHDNSMATVTAMVQKIGGSLLQNYNTLVVALTQIVQLQSKELTFLHELEDGVRKGSFTQDSLTQLLTDLSAFREEVKRAQIAAVAKTQAAKQTPTGASPEAPAQT